MLIKICKISKLSFNQYLDKRYQCRRASEMWNNGYALEELEQKLIKILKTALSL